MPLPWELAASTTMGDNQRLHRRSHVGVIFGTLQRHRDREPFKVHLLAMLRILYDTWYLMILPYFTVEKYQQYPRMVMQTIIGDE